MKALVTGAAGFIGSHLTELLLEEGFQVRAFVRYNSRDSWGWLEKIERDVEIFRGDIRDYDSVREAVSHVDVIFHLAALISIPYSYRTPQGYIRTNIEGTNNLLDAALRNNGLKKFVHISTSEVYGTARYTPIDENHPYNPQSPYAATKAAADMLALTYCRSFDLPVTVVRPFNTFGPRQSLRAVIPTIISQFIVRDGEISIGNTETRRDFLFVRDTVRGILEVGLSENTTGEVVNIGTGRSYSIGEVISIIQEISGIPARVEIDRNRFRPEKSEVDILECDYSKAKRLTGWEPEFDFKKGLLETFNWFKNNLREYKNFEKYNF